MPSRSASQSATSTTNLAGAAAAPRCQHVRYNGQRCAAPARSGSDWCVFHGYDYEGRIPVSTVPEDAATIQLELGRVIRQLQNEQIHTRSAALILYALQIASMNLKRLHTELPFEAPVSVLDERLEEFFAELKRLLAEADERTAPPKQEPASAASAVSAVKEDVG